MPLFLPVYLGRIVVKKLAVNSWDNFGAPVDRTVLNTSYPDPRYALLPVFIQVPVNLRRTNREYSARLLPRPCKDWSLLASIFIRKLLSSPCV